MNNMHENPNIVKNEPGIVAVGISTCNLLSPQCCDYRTVRLVNLWIIPRKVLMNEFINV